MKFLLVIAIVLFFSQPSGFSKTSIVLATTDYCPWICLDKVTNTIDQKQPGIFVEFIQQALKDSEYSVEVILMPYERIQKEILDGSLLGILLDSESVYPKGTVVTTNPLTSQAACFFTRPLDPWTYKTPESIKNRVITTYEGYFCWHSFNVPEVDKLDHIICEMKKSKPNSVFWLKGSDLGLRQLKLLSEKRVDTVFDLKNQVEYASKTHGISVRLAGCLDHKFELAVVLSTKHKLTPKIAALLNEKIKSMQQSGKLKAIFERY
jgi:hypothetical protein